MPSLLGVTTWGSGSDVGGSTTSTSQQPTQSQQKRGSSRGWGYDDYSHYGYTRYNFPSIA